LPAQQVIEDCPEPAVQFHEAEYQKTMAPLAFSHNGTASHSNLKISSFSYNFYYGTMHCHTAYSDGDNDAVCPGLGSSATCCYSIGHGALNFDFMGIADHNHNEPASVMSLAKYNSGLSESANYNASAAGSNFATMYGTEWGTISTGGHVVVHGINKLIGWNASNYHIYTAKGDYNRLFNVVDSLNGYCYLAHPNSTDFSGIFNTAAYNTVWDNVLVGVSLENGPSTSTSTTYTNPPTATPDEVRYKDLLKKGYHVGPVIDLDNHNSATQGKTNQGRTVVLSNSLSKTEVENAYKSMRFYASEDFNVQVLFDINSTFIMGSITTQAINPTLNILVSDVDAGENVTSIEIYYGVPSSGTAATLLTSISNTNSLSYTHNIAAATSNYYYYSKITQADGHRMWTSPIWYSKDIALPVSLVSFTGELQNNNAVIQWETKNEINCSQFNLLKSNDGIVFKKIDTQNCNNETTGSTYKYTDENLTDGIHYYKLTETSNEGKLIDYSTIDLDKNYKNNVNYYYDKSDNSIIVLGNKKINELKLYSISGSEIDCEKNFDDNKVKIKNLHSGIYLLLLNEENTKYYKIIIP